MPSAYRLGLMLAAICEVLRRLDPPGIWVVREHQSAALDVIDHFADDALAKSGTAPAPTNASLHPRDVVADVGRAVHHDRAVDRVIVESAIETLETQRVAVLSD